MAYKNLLFPLTQVVLVVIISGRPIQTPIGVSIVVQNHVGIVIIPLLKWTGWFAIVEIYIVVVFIGFIGIETEARLFNG